jgi:hypothetical protein
MKLSQIKFSSIFFTVYLIFTAFFAEYFISAQSNHEHDHEDGGCCQICHELQIAQAILEGFAGTALIVLTAVFMFYIKRYVKKTAFVLCTQTLVALNVRINA